jgi:hypothetical protein
MWVRLIFIYALVLFFSSVLIYGNRSSFSNQTHDVVLHANQYQVRDDDMPRVLNNKQQTSGIEQISKRKSHCAVHGCSTEINIVMNGLCIKQITVRGKKRMSRQRGFTFN